MESVEVVKFGCSLSQSVLAKAEDCVFGSMMMV